MKRTLVTAALGAALALFWSSGFVGATLSARTAPIDTVLVWRTGIGAVLLALVVLLRGERIPAGEIRRQAGRGVLVQGIYLGGVFGAAAAGVPAGTTALIASLQPLAVAGLAGPLLGTRPTRRQVAGLALGAGGVVVVVAGDLGGAAAWAFLLPVVAVAGLATGTVLEGRTRPSSSLLAGFAVQCATGAVLFAVVAAIRGDLVPPTSGDFWFAIGWLVALSTFGGYGSYLVLVRRTGPTFASALLYLTPPTTALWAWAMFGQVPGSLAIPGVLVTAVGIAIFATRGRVSGARATALRTPRRSAVARVSRGRPDAVATTPPRASRT